MARLFGGCELIEKMVVDCGMEYCLGHCSSCDRGSWPAVYELRPSAHAACGQPAGILCCRHGAGYPHPTELPTNRFLVSWTRSRGFLKRPWLFRYGCRTG